MLLQSLLKISTPQLSFNSSVSQRLFFGPKHANMVTARAIPSKNDLTRWIIIYQNSMDDFNDHYFKLRFTIQDFELPVETNGVPLNLKDRVNKKTWFAANESNIYEVLRKVNINPTFFTTPDQCNYPF